jgi:hypothetical protein
MGFANQAVFVVIPVHNRKAITTGCLARLSQHGALNRYTILVVDDGSTDGTQEAIQSQFPEVTILQGDGNLWWTGAMALGMRYAYDQGAEFIIWLNDDCQFTEQTLPNLVEFCQTNPKSIIGCEVQEKELNGYVGYGGKKKTWKGYRLIQAPPGEVVPCDSLCGNIVCIPRTVIDAIGYPNARAMPHYGGDTLYIMQAKKAGFSIFVDARTPVFNTAEGEPRLYPRNWLLAPGSPLKLLQLTFMPQSGLSWRVWLRLNWEGYSLWGLVMITKKYISILLLTVLRFLPYQSRVRLSTLMGAKGLPY